jgi:hypothetical protein
MAAQAPALLASEKKKNEVVVTENDIDIARTVLSLLDQARQEALDHAKTRPASMLLSKIEEAMMLASSVVDHDQWWIDHPDASVDNKTFFHFRLKRRRGCRDVDDDRIAPIEEEDTEAEVEEPEEAEMPPVPVAPTTTASEDTN